MIRSSCSPFDYAPPALRSDDARETCRSDDARETCRSGDKEYLLFVQNGARDLVILSGAAKENTLGDATT
jgi:hypothetical protein